MLSNIWPRIPGLIHFVSSRQVGSFSGTPVAQRQSVAHSTILLLPVFRIKQSMGVDFDRILL